MPELPLNLLLDQNVPRVVVEWLREQRPGWSVLHVNEIGLQGKPDSFLYRWAQERQAVIVTFDEDFADARMHALGPHCGVIRLRVWPTTIEHTEQGLARLLSDVPSSDWPGSLIILGNRSIRIRKKKSSSGFRS